MDIVRSECPFVLAIRVRNEWLVDLLDGMIPAQYAVWKTLLAAKRTKVIENCAEK